MKRVKKNIGGAINDTGHACLMLVLGVKNWSTNKAAKNLQYYSEKVVAMWIWMYYY